MANYTIRAFDAETHIASVEFDTGMASVKIPTTPEGEYLIGEELAKYISGFQPQLTVAAAVSENGVSNLNSILSMVIETQGGRQQLIHPRS